MENIGTARFAVGAHVRISDGSTGTVVAISEPDPTPGAWTYREYEIRYDDPMDGQHWLPERDVVADAAAPFTPIHRSPAPDADEVSLPYGPRSEL